MIVLVSSGSVVGLQ